MKKFKNNEKGVALLVALFALLLLSAVGLAMMFSSDAETNINANFREKQQMNYAALSGLLEARDRLQPTQVSATATYHANYIPFPTAAPNTTTAQVFYIINPSGTETVAPWDVTNKYFDTAICHDGTLAVCSSGTLNTGSAWRAVYDNSLSSYTGNYKLTNPLSYKWVRIQLKQDNSTPVAVGSSPSGKIVCWDGAHQIPLPTGYNPDCTPQTGSVGTINLTNGGTGYNSAPNVVLTGGGGTGAQATANITPTSTGTISSITLVNAGTGYTSTPTVTITGTGLNATAVATVNGGNVTGVNLASAGNQCYLSAPTVSLTGGGGTGATATANLESNTSCIYSVTGGSCSTWKGNTYTTSATGGNNDFAATIQYHNGTGNLQSVTITNPGTGYTSAPTVLTVSGQGSCTSGSTIQMGKRIQNFTVSAGGSGYVSSPTVTISPGVGTGSLPTATASINSAGGAASGTIANIAVTNGGSGYTAAVVTITGGGGSGAIATANLGTTNTVTGITVTNGGSGYTSPPTVSFTGGGGGTGAAAIAYLANGVDWGQVFQLTAMAMTNSGSKSVAQMEVATPVRRFSVTGALTLAGPWGSGINLFTSPNSQSFVVNGADQNSCGQTAYDTHPAIGVFDDPNHPTATSAQSNVIANLARPDHYTGSAPAPDVENVYSSLGTTMNNVSGMEALATGVASVATNTYTGPVSNVNLGSASTPTVTVVNGDLNVSGNPHGYGILLVTGTLTFGGDFSWNGVILVIGQGSVVNSGGGNGQITGTMLVAKTRDNSGNLLSSLGSPTVDWDGGGGNGILYDHCWADNVLANVPVQWPQSSDPLKILSTRTVTF